MAAPLLLLLLQQRVGKEEEATRGGGKAQKRKRASLVFCDAHEGWPALGFTPDLHSSSGIWIG